MKREFLQLIHAALLFTFIPLSGQSQTASPQGGSPAEARNTALLNGQWFNGTSFEARTVYSVDGSFTAKTPARVDRTIDLAGTWIVPPFGEAHNHNINGIEDRDRRVIQRYLADGVFYVKIQSNLPVSAEMRRQLGLNQPNSIDVMLAQGAISSTGGIPELLQETIWIPRNMYPGHTRESLKDHRYFTVDSEADLEKKWPLILAQRPDFIKTHLWASDEHEKRKDDPAYFGQKGLPADVLSKIVAKAHASNLRVSTHVSNAADFHNALAAGADEISHLPLIGLTPIAVEDAKLAAERGVAVITTCAVPPTMPERVLPKSDLPQVLDVQLQNLRLLHESGVRLAVGSDNVGDSSLKEFEYLQGLGIFDNLTLLKMWTEATAQTIYPDRKIGMLEEGYEASFLALDGNPLDDLQNVRKIKMRFKQGVLLEP